jgi:hypothetical protein
MGLKDWETLARKYFAEQKYDVFVPERGWGERVVKSAAGSEWRAARMLGGTLAAILKKPGAVPKTAPFEKFEQFLRCPDCHGSLVIHSDETLQCVKCGYKSPNAGEVYNLLPSAERSELYPGERADIIDFSLPYHGKQLLEGWYDLEGVYGNKYRWIGARASARLRRVKPGPQRLRIRGHASQPGIPGEVRATVNGVPAGVWKLDRTGLFILEADIPEADEYILEIAASPVFRVDTDDRVFTVNLSMIRLVDRD